MPHYSLPDEVGALDDFLSARTPRRVDEHASWLELVRGVVTSERGIRRVRVIDEPPTDYQCFQVAWRYPQNADAGEEIRTVGRAAFREGLSTPIDFWLFDEQWGFTMVYDYRGHLLTVRELTALEVERCCDVRAHSLRRSAAFISKINS